MATNKGRRIRIAVDIGGTFTDGVAEETPGNRIWVAKRLTTPEDPGIATAEVTVELLHQIAAPQEDARAAERVVEVVHGTTLVTNTIIERNGAKCGLVVTKGTRDVVDIRREVRYDLYDLNLKLPDPVVPTRHRFEIDERMDAQGGELKALNEAEVKKALAALKKQGVEAIAICLLHAYVNDAHEKRIKELLRDQLPGMYVSISSEVAREIREYERMSTTTLNTYVQPLMSRYLAELEGRMRAIKVGAPLRIMVSSGGFTSSAAAAEVPISLLESGPAGGVLSAVNTALEAGISDVLAFDMGGTTAKACVSTGGEPAVAHSFEAGRVHRFKKGSGLPVLIPSIDLIEIGAGGGSIAHISQLGLLNVGPQSSGAVPGPACYAQGGKDATVTDADLILGFLDAENFLGGEMKLDTGLAEKALDRLAKRLKMGPTEVAWGISNLVNENMAAAARVHIAEKGLDPRKFTMVATGGAGPVHVVEVASKLQIKHVLCTIAAGAGSCLGLLAAPARVDRSFSKVELLQEVNWNEVKSVLDALYREANTELSAAGARGERINWTIGVEVRYAGQGNTVQVVLPYRNIEPALGKTLVAKFEERYAQLYGQTVPGGTPQVVTWRLTGRSAVKSRGFKWAVDRWSGKGSTRPIARRRMFLPGKGDYGVVPVYERYALPPGTRLKGPCVLQERESTVVVPRPAAVEILKDLTVAVELR